jgi:pimeloyl-ACP methyl ester carboxylesterase
MALALPIFDPTLAETSVEGLARHVVRFLDALDLHRVVLGGNSLGGHVALHLALTEPERVAGLILTGSSGLFERTVTGRAPHRPSTEWVRARMKEAACRRTYAEAVEFTVAPRYPSTREARGGHDWLVEFAEPPRCSLDVFRRALDETLMALTPTTERSARPGWAWWSLASSNCPPVPSIDGCASAVGSAISTRCRGSPTIGPWTTACSRWPRVRPHRRARPEALAAR